MASIEELREQAAERRQLCRRLRGMVVDRLDLPIDPDWITDDQPLFGRGLELDSVDALELVVGIESEYGVAITDDEMEVFGSVAYLAEHLVAHGS